MNPVGDVTLTDETQYFTVRTVDGTEITIDGGGNITLSQYGRCYVRLAEGVSVTVDTDMRDVTIAGGPNAPFETVFELDEELHVTHADL